MRFIDLVQIKIKAGDGGAGMVHFRREKFNAMGGPDGGNGGTGGSVYIEADSNLGTLLDYRYARLHQAENGGKGSTNDRQGKTGEDLILKVPCGTVAYDDDSGEILGEVVSEGQRICVAKGGNGGVGNAVFVTSRNQAPTKSIPPQPGEQRFLRLELKLIADVGIIGAPNAGKSTLISVISAAKPKVADYPFTTLTPNLGVVEYKNAMPFVVADVPGLIPGANTGKGLGFEFLRHIERTKVLVHLIDASQESHEQMVTDYEGILNELELYEPQLLHRPRLTVLSKLDNVSQNQYGDATKSFMEYLGKKGVRFLEISAANRLGIESLLESLLQLLSETNQKKD